MYQVGLERHEEEIIKEEGALQHFFRCKNLTHCKKKWTIHSLDNM